MEAAIDLLIIIKSHSKVPSHLYFTKDKTAAVFNNNILSCAQCSLASR